MTIHRFRYLFFCLLFACNTTSFSADSLAIEVGNKNINLTYQQALDLDTPCAITLDTSLLYTRQKGHQDLLGGIGLQMTNKHAQPAMNFTLGIKGFISDVLDYRVGAVSVGGIILYRHQETSATSLQASLYYAPEATTTMEGDYFRFIDIALDVKLNPGNHLRLGYREITMGIENQADAELDQGAYAGWVMQF